MLFNFTGNIYQRLQEEEWFFLVISYWLHSKTGCDLLIDLHQFVRKELSVFSGYDWLHWGSKDFHTVFLQDALLE